jgi:hypothetical protein
VEFTIKWTDESNSDFIITKIKNGQTTLTNDCIDDATGIEVVITPKDLLMPEEGGKLTLLDFWPIPHKKDRGTVTELNYLLDIGLGKVASDLRLNSPHVDCWIDVLRMCSDQISSENTRKTNVLQSVQSFGQQAFGLATNFQRSIKQGLFGTEGNIR